MSKDSEPARYNERLVNNRVLFVFFVHQTKLCVCVWQYTMERGVVHACHAGGVVHMLEGWEHHEVGAIDVERIDLVWEAAMRHGLSSVSSLTN